MTPETFQRLGALFDELVEADAEVQSARLAVLREEAPELAQRLASMLAAEQAEQALLDGGAAAIVEPMGQTVGPYRLVERLGAGGMGEVFLAERADGHFDHQVALKIQRHGLAAGPARERFLAERQILAQLSHPNVARLLDGGLLEDGRPWFAMEYVDGLPLDRWLEAHDPPLGARLELFLAVCAAVQFAHTHLVVHRDLKPDNILVDRQGVPKLVDFGIAKVLDDDWVQTQAGDRLMTPSWAAPEQMRGGAITTATDVYALGMLLYHLLSGAHAHGRAASLAELEVIVCERTPPLPSTRNPKVWPDSPSRLRGGQGATRSRTRASTRSSAGIAGGGRRIGPEPQVAGARTRNPGAVQQSAGSLGRTTASSWRRALRGDLDRICMKALRKEPLRRYASVAELAEDIRRFQRGLPVSAQPDTLSYRARKFARRHRVALGVVALVAILVAGFVWQLRLERDRAQASAARATAAAEVMREVFEGLDPAFARGAEVTAEALLTRGLFQAEALAPDQRAELLGVIGRAFLAIGKPDQAVKTHQLALAARDSPAGRLDLAHALRERGDLAESRAQIESVTDPAMRGRALYEAGQTALAETRFEDAKAAFEAALATGPALQRQADLREGLALVAYETDDMAAAEAAYREALALYREAVGEVHPRVAAVLNDLAATLRHQGRLDEAEPLYRQSLEMGRRLFPTQHPDIALTLNHLGRLAYKRGDYDAADALLREALAIREAVFAPDHAAVIASKSALAANQLAQGDAAQAEATYRDLLDRVSASYGEDHAYTAAMAKNLGAVLADRGKLAEAEPVLRQALKGADAVFPEGHRKRSHARLALGGVLRQLGRLDEAEPLLREALALRESSQGADHGDTARARAVLGECLAAKGDVEGAEQALTAALKSLRATRQPDHPHIQSAQAALDALEKKIPPP